MVAFGPLLLALQLAIGVADPGAYAARQPHATPPVGFARAATGAQQPATIESRADVDQLVILNEGKTTKGLVPPTPAATQPPSRPHSIRLPHVSLPLVSLQICATRLQI